MNPAITADAVSRSKHYSGTLICLHKTRLKCPQKLANLIIVVAFSFVITFCIGLAIKENEPGKSIELIVRKDRLPKITPVTIAQLAIRTKCACILTFFSDMSKHFSQIFT